MFKSLTTEEFIKRSKEIHGDKYDYSLVDYKKNNIPVKIICPVHGIFEQRPASHLQGAGCSKCNGGVKITQTEFIEKARSIHNNKYDYSLVEYVNSNTKVKIICPIHGIFEQNPTHHLRGQGCPHCAFNNLINSRRLSTEEFIKRSKEIHGDKYDYSLVEYVNDRSPVKIICPIHGVFEQNPTYHLRGHGCGKCAIEHSALIRTSSTEEFIEKAKKVHGDKYDYSLVKYTGAFNNVDIICPKHGVFKQMATNHLGGKGCPNCKNSISENEIEILLKDNNINFEKQKRFDWLVYNSNMMLDFYLPDYNIAIECQGLQHFRAVEQFGGEDGYNYVNDRDNKKRELCEEHGIKILYYANYKYDFPYNVYTDAEKLIDDIRNNNF